MEEQNTIDVGMEEQPRVSPFNTAMRYGLIGGLVMVVISLLLYLLNLQEITWLSTVVMLGVLGVFIYLGLVNHRDNDLGGYMKYGRGVGTGTLIAVFMGIIGAVYLYIFLSFIDQSVITQAMNEAREALVERGMSDDEIEQALKISGMFMQPWAMAIMSIFAYAFYGVIEALIISIVVKK
jgi:uncharacterized membrane protein